MTTGVGHVRNVVLISFDSLRSDYIARINPHEAPNICLMRDQGVFFPNTIVQAPMTIPSHASIFTGMYPSTTGVRDMHHRLPCDAQTVFTILKEEGMRTIFASQTRMLANRGLKGIEQSIPLQRKKLKQAVTRRGNERFFMFLHYWGTHTPYETRFPSFGPMDLLLNGLQAVDDFNRLRILRRLSRRLWLMRVNRIRALMAKGGTSILSAVEEGYRKAIIRADKFVGDVWSLLSELGVADDTLFVLTGDHGDAFNEHNEIDRAKGRRYEHGQFLYDNIVRVPLILFWPHVRPKRSLPDQVEQVDIAPTIIEALNVDYDGYLDGRSLWGAALGGTGDVGRRFAYSEVFRESLELELRCVRSRFSKLICDYKNNTSELYDLQADPEEQRNLWPADDYEEKPALMGALEAFVRSEDRTQEPDSCQEQEKIEKTLRDLGYM